MAAVSAVADLAELDAAIRRLEVLREMAQECGFDEMAAELADNIKVTRLWRRTFARAFAAGESEDRR